MKKIVLHLTMLFIFTVSVAQIENYDQLKKQGKLTGKENRVRSTKSITPVFKQSGVTPQPLSSCQCWQTVDATWQVVPFEFSSPPDYRNDDESSPLINIPFTFCFYGTNYTSLYINNNGNISFSGPNPVYSANPFPDPTYDMVAPFWGDVDTWDPGSGLVYYKVTATYMIVQWDTVGYYDAYSDKRNTFQLIISNGTDPIIPNGNNVSFCYKDMQWTTGDASGGVNGFGGFPATVGVNKGDGINYIQFGTFDQPGGAYDGPYGNPDGISWLDNKSFFINTCSSTNIPPVANGLVYCDTITLCVGDTLDFNIIFQSPELGQITTATAITNLSGFTIINNTPANNVVFDAQLIAQAVDVGNNTITFSAVDDGAPVQTSSITLVIVISEPISLLTVSATMVGICNGGIASAIATVSGGSGSYTYLWNTTPAQTTQTATSISSGNYTVIVRDTDNCVAAAQATIDVCDSIFVPNVFSPNGDGMNDVFYFPNVGYKTLHCEIYNRWGTKVYEWDDVKGSWDGRTNSGRTAPDGVFYYFMIAEKNTGEVFKNNGFLHLLSNK